MSVEDHPSLTPVLSAFTTAVELLEARRASLLLRRDTEERFTVVASVGIPDPLVSKIQVLPGQGIAGVVAERNTPILGMLDGATFLSVPVVSEDGVEGVLNFTDREGTQPYTTRDVSRASQAADHIGQLIKFDRMVLRDPLTGLYNRRALDDALRREIARSQRLRKRCAVAFLDMDHLKEVNDRYGHAAGDAALGAISTAIERLLRPYDVAARYGGDEFVILITELEEGDVTPESLRARFDESLLASPFPYRRDLGASIGVAYWPDDGRSADEVLAVADARMYEDKKRRR